MDHALANSSEFELEFEFRKNRAKCKTSNKWKFTHIKSKIIRADKIVQCLSSQSATRFLISGYIRSFTNYIIDAIAQLIIYYYGQYHHQLINFKIVRELDITQEIILQSYLSKGYKIFVFGTQYIRYFPGCEHNFPLIYIEYDGQRAIFYLTDFGLHHIKLNESETSNAQQMAISMELESLSTNESWYHLVSKLDDDLYTIWRDFEDEIWNLFITNRLYSEYLDTIKAQQYY